MFVKYGSYVHPSDEAGITFDQRAIRTGRGQPYLIRSTAIGSGSLLADSESAMSAKVTALLNAYATDGLDFGLYHTNGTATPVFLSSSASISGTQVVSKRFPKFDSVYATNYPFQVVVEADYFDIDAPAILEYGETITYIGTGGPRPVGIELEQGFPVIQITRDRTLCRAIQAGRALGRLGYYVNPPLFPAFLVNPDNAVSYDAPFRHGTGFTGYGASWTYQYLSTVPFTQLVPTPI